jgi:RimJ/RimL family protein N-acetyltransferase
MRGADQTPHTLPGGSALLTPRLRLVPFAPEQLLALLGEPDRFPPLMGWPAADGLRDFFVSADVSPEWVAILRASSAPDPWRHGYAVVESRLDLVIGTGGFKGPPDADGTVEIAYGIVPAFEGRGYATEVARALAAHAWADHRVRRVWAHTLPDANASTRVLEKNGFRCLGEVNDPADGRVWRWELDSAR